MSLTALATTAGVSKSHLSVIENGTGGRAGARVLFALADALGVTIAELHGRELRAAAPDGDRPPEGLLEFAAERVLPQADIDMLAGIRFGGERPRSKERWAFIYNAITTSRGLDSEDVT